MATATSLSMNVRSTGVSVSVPDNDLARLMYYLHCVTVGVGLDILHDDLVDYKNYWRLTPARKALVYKSALEFSPDEFINKLIFRDDAGEVTKRCMNEFCSISVACGIVSLRRDVIIAGKVQNITKVMFFRSGWLDKNYSKPMSRFLMSMLLT
jgi:hypothetical protein